MSDSNRAERQTDDLGGFAPTYGVELLYEELPPLPKAKLCAALKQRSPESHPLDGNAESGLLAFVHTAHLAHGSVPAQCLPPCRRRPSRNGRCGEPLQRKWTAWRS